MLCCTPVPTDPSLACPLVTAALLLQAYKLLQGAAGMYEFVQSTCAPLLAGVCPSPDMHPLVSHCSACLSWLELLSLHYCCCFFDL